MLDRGWSGLRRVCHAHRLAPQALESNSAWFPPTNSGCPEPLLQTLHTKKDVQKGEEENGIKPSSALLPSFTEKNRDSFLGPLPRDKIGDENIYLFLRLLQSPDEKPTLVVTYCSSSCFHGRLSPQAAAHSLRSWGKKFYCPTGEKKWDPCPNRNWNYEMRIIPYWHRGAVNSPAAPVESPELALCQRFYINQGLLGD